MAQHPEEGLRARKNAVGERQLLQACHTSPEEAFARAESTPAGLTSAEAKKRLSQFGANHLTGVKRTGLLRDLFEHLRNPLVIQLLIICGVSYVMGDLRSALVVGAMLLLSVGLAYFQERRSSLAAERLQDMVQACSAVLRDGREIELPVEDVVPGDVVILASGDIIPADLRIVHARDFFVSQSALTGESLPVEKNASVVPADMAQVTDAQCACFQGSNVISGSARGLVINTGMDTVLGGISHRVNAPRESTDFDRGIRGFVWLMVRFMVVMVSVVFLIVGITKHDWLQALLFSLSVAVGLTPEMLPMILTVCLSRGAMAMAKKRVIVKRLQAIQNFGAMDILCTDKTGTLTQDSIILERYVDVANRKSEDVLKYAYMNSYYQTGLRNLLDKAILAHEDLDVERDCHKVDELPFDFSRKRMSVVIDYEDRHVLICKGAVEEVYAVCESYQIDDEVYPLFDMVKHDLLEDYHALSAEGYRVLAVAYREHDRTKSDFSTADEARLILLGYVAFFDPPRDSAMKALQALGSSGVSVKLLTGDNELVTAKVCRDVNLSTGRVITGGDLQGLREADFDRTVSESSVFARLSPSQKEEIIRSLKRQGHVVGFLGDGINDAPAMRAADVGISVDSAVDIARESADIILLEKSLLVLQDGIVEGRRIFANVIKYIKMGASSNFGNMFSVVGGSYFLPFLPMAPLQVLANNLLYDLSQVAIPVDAVDTELIEKPHRWNIDLIRRFMMVVGPISSIFDYATYGLMLFVFDCARFAGAASVEAKQYYESLFHTGWFVESLLTQTLIVHIIRTNRIPFIQSRPAPALVLTTILVMACGSLLPYSPLAAFLGLVPLPWTYWLWILAFLFGYTLITHRVKVWFFRRYGM